MSEWIAVTERLPDKDAADFRVLVRYVRPSFRGYIAGPYIDLVAYGLARNDNAANKEGWAWEYHFHELGPLVPCNSWIPDDWVTHWMSLPDPPAADSSTEAGR